MPGRGARADGGDDPAAQLLGEWSPVLQSDEQPDLLVAVRALTHRHGLADLRHGLEGPVDLGRTYAHATRVEGGVRAAVDHDAALHGALHQVAMTPQTLVDAEVGVLVTLVVLVAEEREGHGG